MSDPALRVHLAHLDLGSARVQDRLLNTLCRILYVTDDLHHYPFRHLSGPEAVRCLASEIQAVIYMQMGVGDAD